MGTADVKGIFFPEETLRIVQEAKNVLAREGLPYQPAHVRVPKRRNDNTLVGSLDSIALGSAATHPTVYKACEEALEFACATVVLPPSMLEYAKYSFEENHPPLHLTAAISFPYGDDTAAGKTAQMRDVANCCDEYEIMINTAAVKDRDWRYIFDETEETVRAAGDKDTTITLDGDTLNLYEISIAGMLALRAECAYLKYLTNTPVTQDTIDRIAVLRMIAGEGPGVKVSAHIKTCDMAVKFIDAGADRIGTAHVADIAKAAGFMPQHIGSVSRVAGSWT